MENDIRMDSNNSFCALRHWGGNLPLPQRKAPVGATPDFTAKALGNGGLFISAPETPCLSAILALI
jgi:hypothetical protein